MRPSPGKTLPLSLSSGIVHTMPRLTLPQLERHLSKQGLMDDLLTGRVRVTSLLAESPP